jgi:hypothetical protein
MGKTSRNNNNNNRSGGIQQKLIMTNLKRNHDDGTISNIGGVKGGKVNILQFDDTNNRNRDLIQNLQLKWIDLNSKMTDTTSTSASASASAITTLSSESTTNHTTNIASSLFIEDDATTTNSTTLYINNANNKNKSKNITDSNSGEKNIDTASFLQSLSQEDLIQHIVQLEQDIKALNAVGVEEEQEEEQQQEANVKLNDQKTVVTTAAAIMEETDSNVPLFISDDGDMQPTKNGATTPIEAIAFTTTTEPFKKLNDLDITTNVHYDTPLSQNPTATTQKRMTDLENNNIEESTTHFQFSNDKSSLSSSSLDDITVINETNRDENCIKDDDDGAADTKVLLDSNADAEERQEFNNEPKLQMEIEETPPPPNNDKNKFKEDKKTEITSLITNAVGPPQPPPNNSTKNEDVFPDRRDGEDNVKSITNKDSKASTDESIGIIMGNDDQQEDTDAVSIREKRQKTMAQDLANAAFHAELQRKKTKQQKNKGHQYQDQIEIDMARVRKYAAEQKMKKEVKRVSELNSNNHLFNVIAKQKVHVPTKTVIDHGKKSRRGVESMQLKNTLTTDDQDNENNIELAIFGIVENQSTGSSKKSLGNNKGRGNMNNKIQKKRRFVVQTTTGKRKTFKTPNSGNTSMDSRDKIRLTKEGKENRSSSSSPFLRKRSIVLAVTLVVAQRLSQIMLSPLY